MIFSENKLPCCNFKINKKVGLQQFSRKYDFRKSIGGGDGGGMEWTIKVIPLQCF